MRTFSSSIETLSFERITAYSFELVLLARNKLDSLHVINPHSTWMIQNHYLIFLSSIE